MTMELDNLIQKIKEEGVEEAKRRSEEIMEEAENEAKRILGDAQQKKATIIREGEKRALALTKNGEEALRQSARDVLLSLRQRIIELFDCVTKESVSKELTQESLSGLIAKAIENFKREEELDIEVLLSKHDKAALEATLLKRLKERLKKGVTFKVASAINKGFRVGEKGKEFYYDFTDDAIKEAFGLYLNPKIKEILNLKSEDGK